MWEQKFHFQWLSTRFVSVNGFTFYYSQSKEIKIQHRKLVSMWYAARSWHGYMWLMGLPLPVDWPTLSRSKAENMASLGNVRQQVPYGRRGKGIVFILSPSSRVRWHFKTHVLPNMKTKTGEFPKYKQIQHQHQGRLWHYEHIIRTPVLQEDMFSLWHKTISYSHQRKGILVCLWHATASIRHSRCTMREEHAPPWRWRCLMQ